MKESGNPFVLFHKSLASDNNTNTREQTNSPNQFGHQLAQKLTECSMIIGDQNDSS